jgi:hypothetical protein
MRSTFRLKIGNLTFFFMVAHTQRLEGLTSLQKDGRHIVLWDIEGCTLTEAEETLRNVQQQYNLSNIFIVSDAERSFRAWCFSRVDFKTYLRILLDTQHLDSIFFDYTFKRKKATLRVSNKANREPQRLVSVLKSYSEPLPSHAERVIYDTGLQKRGFSVQLGGGGN